MPGGDDAPLLKSSDGPVSLLLNRRISTRFSGPTARAGFSPNAETFIALVIGVLGCAAYAVQIWWLGGLLVQFSSIFAGVDGEIARRITRASRYGDFFDTVSDRFVEYAAFVAIAFGLGQIDRWEEWAWPLGIAALGATFMLASASEKYRSVMHSNYPKRQLEPFFAYLVSGRDVRVFHLAVASVIATWNVDVRFWTVAAMAALMHFNFVYRALILRSRMDDPEVAQGKTGG